MIKAGLMGFKICNLSIYNNIEGDGPVKLKHSFHFDAKFDEESKMALGTLTEKIELDGHYEQFHLNLEIQGVFEIENIKSNNDKKAANLIFYEELFPYASQIIAYLALDCGFPGLRIEKHTLELNSIHFGERPKNGKIIEMK